MTSLVIFDSNSITTTQPWQGSPITWVECPREGCSFKSLVEREVIGHSIRCHHGFPITAELLERSAIPDGMKWLYSPIGKAIIPGFAKYAITKSNRRV